MPNLFTQGRALVAFDRALASAESAWQRQAKAAKHCVGGEAKRVQLQVSAARLREQWDTLRRLRGTLLEAAETLETIVDADTDRQADGEGRNLNAIVRQRAERILEELLA